MGLFDKLFGRKSDDDSPVVSAPLDQEARTAQLIELEKALEDLLCAMKEPPSPVSNPGWQGRVKDYEWMLGGCSLARRATITRDALSEITAGMRPVFGPDGPPEGLDGIAALSDTVIAKARALEAPLPSEQ